MGVVSGHIAAVIDALAAEGINATADPRNAHPPCAFVKVETITPRTPSLIRAETVITLIAPGPGNADALTWLDDALAAVWRAIPTRPGARLVAWTSPHTGQDLLAYELRPIASDYEHHTAQPKG